MSVTGGCQCGAVRYALDVGSLENCHVCHCRMCQRATGGVFAALAGAPKAAVRWTSGAPSFFASSNIAKRGFCEQCGTSLTFAYDQPDARFYVTIGSLDDPAAAAIERQYGIESRVPWVEFCEAVPQEKTGEASDALSDFFAGMQSRQSDG